MLGQFSLREFAMKSDLKLVREIMLRIEAPKTLDEQPYLNIDDFSQDDILFNTAALIDNGFVNGNVVRTMGGTRRTLIALPGLALTS